MRRVLFSIFEYGGVNAVFRFFHRHALTIVLYHGVAPKKEQGIYNYRGKFITPEAFKKQLAYFRQHYVPLELEDAVCRLREGTLPRNALAVTFDDGYRNFYQYAYPILHTLGVPTTMFLPTDFILEKKPLWVDRLEYAAGRGTGTFKEKAARDAKLRDELKRMDAPERERALADIEHASGASFSDFEGERSVYAPLSLDDIEEMRKGGVRFGAHTRTHPILSRTTSEHALEEEMNGARDALERNIGSISRFFAYPNGQSGDWDRRAERLLENAGCPGAVTTLEGVNTRETHPLRLRRMVLDATDEGWVFAAIASGVRLWLRKIKDMRPVRNHTRARAPEGPTGRAISNGMRTEVSYFNDTSSSYLAEYGRETPEGYSFRVRRDKVLALLPNGASKKILDLASGPGVMIKGLRAKGYTVTCVDAAPDMIELAKKEAGDDPNVTCEVGDAYHLRFDDALFDAVTVMGLIEYLEDETAYLKETARVLKPGGTLIITVPNVWSPWRVWNRMLRGIRAFVRPSKAGLLHREYTRRGFGALLENTGFSVRAVRYYNFKLVPYPLDRFLPRLTVWQSALFEKLDRTPLRFLGTGFIVEAAKN